MSSNTKFVKFTTEIQRETPIMVPMGIRIFDLVD